MAKGRNVLAFPGITSLTKKRQKAGEPCGVIRLPVYRSFFFLSAENSGSHCNLLTVASKPGKINPSRTFSTIFSTAFPAHLPEQEKKRLLPVLREGICFAPVALRPTLKAHHSHSRGLSSRAKPLAATSPEARSKDLRFAGGRGSIHVAVGVIEHEWPSSEARPLFPKPPANSTGTNTGRARL